MKATELTQKSDKELIDFINQMRDKIIAANIDLRTKDVANVREIRNYKRSLARALTIQTERSYAKLEKENG